ncbi:MAG: hypothetical protein CMD27_00945 [Flavobacteriales bacterium]|nr:hypothetical protein [Flavobacteriales bacterium]
MKNILSFVFSLFYISFYAQNGGCPDSVACNYDSTAETEFLMFSQPTPTDSNMSFGVISTLTNNLQINDQIGAFILLGDGTYYCVGLSTYEGENITIAVVGDDPITPLVDGCPPNEPIYFFVKREDSGQAYVYDTEITLVEFETQASVDNTYITNAIHIFTQFNVMSLQYQCEYPLQWFNCDGTCVDVDDDGVCDVAEIYGCTDDAYVEFSQFATEDDGSCITLVVLGCTDDTAFNYNPLANTDDGSCIPIIPDCMDELACNYNPDANAYNPAACEYPPSGYNCDGSCVDSDGDCVCDVIDNCPLYANPCENIEPPDDCEILDSCIQLDTDGDGLGDLCDDDIDGDGVLNVDEVPGCMDNLAHNFDIIATDDDGSCDYYASVDFSNMNDGLYLDELEFENVKGVTISFWMSTDQLNDNSNSEWSYLVDLGSLNDYRYVIRWRNGVKGLQAYYEGDGFLSNCISASECYDYNNTNATYMVPPEGTLLSEDTYNWYASNTCDERKHVTAVFCSNATKIYVDGKMVQQSSTGLYSSAPIFNLINSSSFNKIGASNDNETGTSWSGKIDEVRIWSRALSHNEIKSRLYQDIDIDGIINSEDEDIDGDGIYIGLQCLYSCNDNDQDIDNDGEYDNCGLPYIDLNGDGICNFGEVDCDNDGINNVNDDDIDGDGVDNDNDDDIDGDGIDNDNDDFPDGIECVSNCNDDDDTPFGVLGFSNTALNTLEELSNNSTSGKLEGYWTFDSLTLNNKVNGAEANFGGFQYNWAVAQQSCEQEVNNLPYSTVCSDNLNNDCDACTPAEGCMDDGFQAWSPNPGFPADNYDAEAEIDDGLCIYYGCMDNGDHEWSRIPGLAACNYMPFANVNQFSMEAFQNPCEYPEDIFGQSYLDCDGQCLYDCDDDGACDWMPVHCYDLEYNLISPDCPEISFTPMDNCFPNSNYPGYVVVDLYNNLTGAPGGDGIQDCDDDFDYSIFSNPLQTDSDGDGIGNSCDNNSSGGDGDQEGCMDNGYLSEINGDPYNSLYPGYAACNYDFWADIDDGSCEYCYLDDCDNYPSISVGGPYDCLGYCADYIDEIQFLDDGSLNPTFNQVISGDLDGDGVCNTFDNCPEDSNPSQADFEEPGGPGDACDGISLDEERYFSYKIYPNPFSDYTIISFESSNILTVLKIFEPSGRLVYQNATNDNFDKVFSSKFSSGIYLLEINQGDKLVRDFLIIQ